MNDFKLGMDVVIKAYKDWRDVGRPQVAVHSQLSHFLVIVIIIYYAISYYYFTYLLLLFYNIDVKNINLQIKT